MAAHSMRPAWEASARNARQRAEYDGTQKKCLKCSKVKPLSGFYPHAKGLGGHTSICAVCSNRASKRYYRKRVRLAKQRPVAPAADAPPSPMAFYPTPQRRGIIYTIKAMLGFASAP